MSGCHLASVATCNKHVTEIGLARSKTFRVRQSVCLANYPSRHSVLDLDESPESFHKTINISLVVIDAKTDAEPIAPIVDDHL